MKIQRAEGPLVEQATNILQGSIALDNAIVFPESIATMIGNDLTAFDVSVVEHNNRKSATRVSRSIRREVKANALRFSKDATSVLKPHLGNRFNLEWEKVAMQQGSIAAPRTTDELLQRLTALKNYFLANPAFESASANVTALRAGALAAELANATAAVNSGITQERSAAVARVMAREALAETTRLAITTLEKSLTDDDLRWATFNLPRPVDIRRPEVPAMPVLTPFGLGRLQVSWAPARRASRYRVFVQAPGDEEPKAVATVRDPGVILEDQPTGVLLKISVTAANRSGESLPSETAEITLE